MQSGRKELLGGPGVRQGSHIDAQCFTAIPAEGGVPLPEPGCGTGLAPAAAMSSPPPNRCHLLLRGSLLHLHHPPSHSSPRAPSFRRLFIMLPFNFPALSPPAHLLPSFLPRSLAPSLPVELPLPLKHTFFFLSSCNSRRSR